jgi:hypothetical protein
MQKKSDSATTIYQTQKPAILCAATISGFFYAFQVSKSSYYNATNANMQVLMKNFFTAALLRYNRCGCLNMFCCSLKNIAVLARRFTEKI